MNATANVPIMDYWRYAYKMLPKIYGGGITFSDLWEPINGQRGLHHSIVDSIQLKLLGVVC